MPTQTRQLALVLCALVTLSACDELFALSELESKLPIERIDLTVSESEWPTFFEALHSFAKRNEFEIAIRPVQPDGRHFAIHMLRDDVEVVGTNPFEVVEFRIRFYENKTGPVSKQVIDDLISNLRMTVSEYLQ